MRLLVLITLLLASCVQAEAGIVEVHDFGSYLKTIVVKNDHDAFLRLPCFPSDCTDNDDVGYVFGVNGNPSFIKSFLESNRVRIKVFGPFTYDDSNKGFSFILMYFDPKIVKFNDKGRLSEVDRKEMWWRGYVETVVHYQNGIVGFQNTPFYHGAHLPWIEDY